ncbi:MAG: DNA repair protein RecN [Erysipelotrichaceae bacterium]|nr:DNA repair protein RecN [Erysipelotrichaceae bacterium]
MLKHLYIKDYVIIDEVDIDFSSGMSVFTGETGAGKSIIIDAIGLLCGSRLTNNIVSAKADKALIEGVFTLEKIAAQNILTEAGFELADEYIISREITRDGKSTMRLNYRTITQAFARDLLNNVVDIHNQHETQYLLNSKTHRQLLDNFISDHTLLNQVSERYRQYHKFAVDLKEKLQTDYNEDEIEYLTFQKNEIEKADLHDGEYDELINKQREIMSFEKLNNHLNSAIETIAKNEGVLEKLFLANKALNELADNQQVNNWNQILKDKYYEIEEVINAVQNYKDSLYYDEEELNKLQDRLFFLGKIKRKYGETYQEIQAKYQNICDKLDIINNRQEYIQKAQRQVDEALSKYREEADKLTELRRRSALELEKQIKLQLAELQLPNTQFEIIFETCDPSQHGSEDVEFMISTNIGQPLSPLSKIASGGELSRIMLGLKAIFSKLQGISTIIFDEIDSGVSGSIATAIGLKMHYLSHYAQVFAVTHLGQVAACADHHYFVSKKSTNTDTRSRLDLLDYNQRINELAMISSGKITDSSLKAAKELLDSNQAMVH